MNKSDNEKLVAFFARAASIQWFVNFHKEHQSAVVVADIVDGWDGWNDKMLATWLPRTHHLEAIAQEQLTDSGIDRVFTQVGESIEQTMRDSLQSYFDHREAISENQELNADLGLWPELVGKVLQDLSWAAIEELTNDKGLFTDLLEYYGQGRWPCAWEGTYPDGRAVIL